MQTAYKYTMICVTIFNTGMLFNILKKKMQREAGRTDQKRELEEGGREVEREEGK